MDTNMFFPVIALIALVLIILSFKLLFRFFVFFLCVFGVWYLLYVAGFVASPGELIRSYKTKEETKKTVVTTFSQLPGSQPF